MIHSAPFLCPPRYNLLKSFTVFLICTLMLCDSALLANPLPTVTIASGKGMLKIPASMGVVQDRVSGTSGKMIVLIQDAHDSIEAQENIAAMIQHLVNHEGVKTVYEEGFEGKVPTDELFGFIQDADLKRKVAYFFLDRLRIGGAEYAHINRKERFRLIGADNISLHMENIAYYRKHMKNQDEVDRDLSMMQNEVKKLAHQHFPNDLKEWLKWKERFEKHQLNPADYIYRIVAMLVKRGLRLRVDDYPSVSFLLQKGNPHFNMLEAFHTGALLSEIQALEDMLAVSYLKTVRQKEIFDTFMKLELLKRLNHFDVTQAEYASITDPRNRLKTEEVAQFISEETEKALVFSKAWETKIINAVRFYETAEKRHEALREHLNRFQNNRKEKIAVVVYGGFHRSGIEAILKQRRFSYVVTAPHIPKRNDRHQQYYRRLMNGERFIFEEPLAPAIVARVLTLPEKQGFFGNQTVRTEIVKILKIVESIQQDMDLKLLMRKIDKQLRFQEFEKVSPPPHRPLSPGISYQVNLSVHKWLGALTLLAVSGAKDIAPLMTGELPRAYFWDHLKDDSEVRSALEILQGAYERVIEDAVGTQMPNREFLDAIKETIRQTYGVVPPASQSLSIRELETIRVYLKSWLQDKEIEDRLHLSRFSLDVRTKVPDEVLLSIFTPERVRIERAVQHGAGHAAKRAPKHAAEKMWTYRYPRKGPLRLKVVYAGPEKQPIYVAYDMNPNSAEVEPHEIVISHEAYARYLLERQEKSHLRSTELSSVSLPYVENQIRNAHAKHTVFMPAGDFLALTDNQRESFEKLGHWFRLKFVFYVPPASRTLLERSQLTKLQESLGVENVLVTIQPLKTLFERHAHRGASIHLSREKISNLNRQMIEAVKGKEDIYFFRYLGDEVGLLAVALRYAASAIKFSSSQILDISMADSLLVEEMKEIQRNLVFARRV